MAVQKAETLGDYLGLLRRDSRESEALFDDLLIKVTEFFRDAPVFEALKQGSRISRNLSVCSNAKRPIPQSRSITAFHGCRKNGGVTPIMPHRSVGNNLKISNMFG